MSLISYEQALMLMRESLWAPSSVVTLPLESSEGLALAESVLATSPNPRFDNSAVDGYLLAHPEDAQAGARLEVVASIAAGAAGIAPISRGTCARVFTGALVPDWGYGVVMQEDVDVVSNGAIVVRTNVAKGSHIRTQGLDFKKGDVLLQQGEAIRPSVTGLLASQGYQKVNVHPPPKCAVLSTGDELVDVDSDPAEGQIRDSNGPMLRQLITESGCGRPTLVRVPDDLQALRDHVGSLAATHDLIVISGGVSVGGFDFVGEAIADLGRVIFHGCAIKPGKPVLMGRIQSCVVFGLPGNPASVYVTFHLFVRKAILSLAGHKSADGLWVRLPFLDEYNTKGREEFVRATLGRDGARLVCEQASFGLLSIARGDCLVRIPPHTRHCAGEFRDVLIVR